MTHVLINALSMGSGGGFTVGRELLRNLALQRPAWKLSFAIIAGHTLHEQIKLAPLPANVFLLEAPAGVMPRRQRARWERAELTRWAEVNDVNVVVQLNGMLVPGMKPPTLCHMQDPWPYRSEAWNGWKDRLIALLKRRQHRRALKNAACFGWTSNYLRELICSYHKIWPACSEVLYNGVPPEWIERATGELAPLAERPLEIVTVSNVNFYKRQALVIRALPLLIRRPGLERLKYRMVGQVESPAFQAELQALAHDCGVGERVIFEGRVNDARLAEVFASARCYVLMSVCESFGIPAIEAMSFGTPVVTADCCAMPEVCADAAELAKTDDLHETADHIARVLLDQPRAQELIARGVQRVAHFSWTSVAQRMAQLLEKTHNELQSNPSK